MHDDTRVIHLGRDPQAQAGAVNPPVYHASTILFPTVAELQEASRRIARDEQAAVYGRRGTPSTFAFENAVAELEGGYRALTYPSGLAAVAAALLAVTRSGDHVLMTDSAYSPSRHVCDAILKRNGVETTYYDPLIGTGISELIRPNTRAVYLEAPGSLTFEMQDVPAIAAAARARGVRVLMDNTWATPLYFKPFDHGVDISIHAATKYIVGHSDAMLGVVVANQDAWPERRDMTRSLGQCAGPDDVYLAQRGLRTMATRLRHHHEAGLELAAWLRAQPAVARVLHPGLPEDPGHAIWKRDFRGASGLFSIVLKPCSPGQLAAMADHLDLFGMGYSWGGYESLFLPSWPQRDRTAVPWQAEGQLVRIHAGLEAMADLKADLAAGFARLAAAG